MDENYNFVNNESHLIPIYEATGHKLDDYDDDNQEEENRDEDDDDLGNSEEENIIKSTLNSNNSSKQQQQQKSYQIVNKQQPQQQQQQHYLIKINDASSKPNEHKIIIRKQAIKKDGLKLPITLSSIESSNLIQSINTKISL